MQSDYKSEAPSLVPRLPAATPSDSRDNETHIASINTALQRFGVAIVDLQFQDPHSVYLHHLVQSLCKHHNHGPPITHSSTEGWFWDVRPKPEKTVNQARSESMFNFPWHTDCSFESAPPQFFALHVLHADRNGGGTFSALSTSDVMAKLTPNVRQCLTRPEFQITVPPEFAKGVDSIIGNLACQSVKDRHGRLMMRFRYRADITQPLSNQAEEALRELNAVLTPSPGGAGADIDHIKMDLTPQILPDNSIVLMDNGRWMHARNEVKDKRRHLRRIRWGRRDFAPWNIGEARVSGE